MNTKITIGKDRLEKWKKVFKNVEKADMVCCQFFSDCIKNGEPIYKTDKNGVKIRDKNKRCIIIGYEPLTTKEQNKLFKLLREMQGKDKNYTPPFLLENSKIHDKNYDPLREKLNILKAGGKLKPIREIRPKIKRDLEGRI